MVAEWPRLVLLCGPPCSGKSALCSEHSSVSGGGRLRFSSEEGTMLNALVKKAGRALSGGQAVVIDDQNLLPTVRERILNGILQKSGIDRSASMCVVCEPEGGRLQCEWENEWNMADAAMSASGEGGAGYLPLADSQPAASLVYSVHRKRALMPWFPNGHGAARTFPSEESVQQEGFAKCEKCTIPLRRALHGSFSTSCLVVDGGCVLSAEGTGLSPVPGAATALSQWQRDHRSSRVVVLLQPSLLFERRASDEDENERLLSQDTDLQSSALAGLRALASQMVRGKLYYLWISPTPPLPLPSTSGDDPAGSADALRPMREPDGSMVRALACAASHPRARQDGRLRSLPLAWVVRRHQVALDALLHVCNGCSSGAPSADCEQAVECGIRHLGGHTFLERRGEVDHLVTRTPVPPFLRPFCAPAAPLDSRCEEEPPLVPSLPSGEQGTPAAERAFGREHGVVLAAEARGVRSHVSRATSDGRPLVAERSCPCGGGTCRVLVASSSEHLGRRFYKCHLSERDGGCAYFAWVDEEASALADARATRPLTAPALASRIPPDEAPPPPHERSVSVAPPGPSLALPPDQLPAIPRKEIEERLPHPRKLVEASSIRKCGGLSEVTIAPLSDRIATGVQACCRGSNLESYQLELELQKPPAPLIQRRSCTCHDFKNRCAASGDVAAQSICKHLAALLLELQHRAEQLACAPSAVADADPCVGEVAAPEALPTARPVTTGNVPEGHLQKAGDGIPEEQALDCTTAQAPPLPRSRSEKRVLPWQQGGAALKRSASNTARGGVRREASGGKQTGLDMCTGQEPCDALQSADVPTLAQPPPARYPSGLGEKRGTLGPQAPNSAKRSASHQRGALEERGPPTITAQPPSEHAAASRLRTVCLISHRSRCELLLLDGCTKQRCSARPIALGSK
ncbi:hypothetical protein AB1Y20_020422 [Prymnesium parvum]|uniref:SWIM-type domain-containing protein n=1 Tax=Prymnesium parvum TaxID=97485 RepID=A0AB34JX29_PRYPA